MIERIELAEGYSISRLLVGGWQLSEGHNAGGKPDPSDAFDAFCRIVEAGLTTFDCADIYVGVEELFGELLWRYRNDPRRGRTAGGLGSSRRVRFQIHTKFVPDLDVLPDIDRTYVEHIVDRSLLRLGVDRLDLVQFGWWDYSVPRYVETAMWLNELQAAGKIRNLGATNFDVPRLREMIEAGVGFVSNQVQYSVLDNRPDNGMVEYCRRHDLKLLCYGTLAGGFLANRYLGAPEPGEPFANRSLAKYKLIVDEFGGWVLFQELLTTLQRIAGKHGVSLANVAVRYVLDRPCVAGAIVGARNADHLGDNLRAFGFQLDREDLDRIHRVIDKRAGPGGDTYDLERVAGGPHAVIMKYNLNREGS